MGICLDTEAKPIYGHAETFQSAKLRSDRVFVQENGAGNKNRHPTVSYSNGSMANGTQFELVRTPVIFVLGGPGSGKISHSERLARQRKGFVHINLIETLLQHLEGSDIRDISLIPTSVVTRELMGAIKTRSNKNGFIVSGYPRNMRDVADYLERVGRCDGVILINWQDETLGQQIAYGSQIGEISLEQAKMELSNFRKHVIPVAEYFDYKQLLYVIQGERHPDNIFADYTEAFERILEAEVLLSRPRPRSSGSYRDYRHVNEDENAFSRHFQSATYPGLSSTAMNSQVPTLNGGHPFVIWINGGPGSSKADKMDEIAMLYPAWRIISTGSLLWRYLEEQDPRHDQSSNFISAVVQRSDDHITSSMIYNVMTKGEMVPQGIVLDLVLDAMAQYRHSEVEGFFITGFPRDIVQAQGFEERTGLKSPCILIDCSELELGRNLGQRHGRIDDNVESYRRRLELYRELTLPMLKTLDEQNRLKIIDGDSDGTQVVKELRRCLHREIGALRRERAVESIDEIEHQEGGVVVNVHRADLDHWKSARLASQSNRELTDRAKRAIRKRSRVPPAPSNWNLMMTPRAMMSPLPMMNPLPMTNPLPMMSPQTMMLRPLGRKSSATTRASIPRWRLNFRRLSMSWKKREARFSSSKTRARRISARPSTLQSLLSM